MLPTTIFAHGWIYYEQDKMSKSKGNVVYPEPIVDALDSFGAPGNDALRYYLLREAPFGQDTSFSYDALIQRFNSDLANDLGNLANRTIAMIKRYFGGEVPQAQNGLTDTEEMLRSAFFGERVMDGDTLITERSGLTSEYISFLDAFDLDTAVACAWHLISKINKYLVEREPWKLAESGREEDRALLTLVLYTAADLLRTITILLFPIMPASSKRLWEQLGCEGKVEDQRLDQLAWAALASGTKVGKPEAIFPRLDKEKTLAKLYELAEADREQEKAKAGALREAPLQTEHEKPKEKKSMESQGTKAPTPQSRVPSPTAAAPGTEAPRISIEDFAKVEMRVGEIQTAEAVAGAQKLLKLTVDIGSEVRQVVAGIAEHYKPEQLIGMKVVIVTNLQPRKLRGVESNGMIVAASVGPEGKPVLVTFKEDVPNGARLK